MADSSSSYRFIELRRRAFEQLPCAQGRALHGLQRLDKAALSFDKAGKRAEDEVQAIVLDESGPLWEHTADEQETFPPKWVRSMPPLIRTHARTHAVWSERSSACRRPPAS